MLWLIIFVFIIVSLSFNYYIVLCYILVYEYIDGKEQSKEKLDEMQNLYSIVIQNETSRKLLENEMKINVMLADMQKIIGDALKDIIDF